MIAPGQRSFMPWPYVEGLTMAEATNDLAFIVTGAYGKPVAKVQGAPIRLATPWKYGFKSAKSIVKISFVADRPQTFWQHARPRRIRLLGQRQSGRAASALEPGARDLPDDRRAARRRCSSTATASRSPRSTRGWRKSRSTCERGAASVAPALRLGDEEVAERLHAGDVLHFLGIDQKAIHFRHVRLRQQPHEAGIRLRRNSRAAPRCRRRARRRG